MKRPTGRTSLRTRITTLILLPAALLLLQACGNGTPPPNGADPTPPGTEPVALRSNMPTNQPGAAGTEYTFTFVYDENAQPAAAFAAQAAGDRVVFNWTFGDGTEAGEATVTVGADGVATYEVSHTYVNEGRYGLVMTVDDETGTELARRDFIIEIGTLDETWLDMTECTNGWSAGGDGAYGVTIDRWDISALPDGTVFDFRYDAYAIPDKFIVGYPNGTVRLDTGWVGADYYEGDPKFPGGISGDGAGQVDGLFTKGASDEFLVTIIGPDPGTYWSYEVRCTVP